MSDTIRALEAAVAALKNTATVTSSGLPYVIVRTYSAGVFAGELKERAGKEATVLNARRLWRWAGAASLSELAMSGTSNPGECKFPIPVTSVLLTEVIEILEVTEVARKSIEGVPVWSSK